MKKPIGYPNHKESLKSVKKKTELQKIADDLRAIADWIENEIDMGKSLSLEVPRKTINIIKIRIGHVRGKLGIGKE